MFLAFICLATFVFVVTGNHEFCKYSRDAAVVCAKKYGDKNNDGKLSYNEIDNLRESTLYWYEKLASFAIGKTTARVMRDCDFDRDGEISKLDFEQSYDTCLKDCGSVTDFFHYVCDRQAALET